MASGGPARREAEVYRLLPRGREGGGRKEDVQRGEGEVKGRRGGEGVNMGKNRLGEGTGTKKMKRETASGISEGEGKGQGEKR